MQNPEKEGTRQACCQATVAWLHLAIYGRHVNGQTSAFMEVTDAHVKNRTKQRRS